jgi:hypothetical protein
MKLRNVIVALLLGFAAIARGSGFRAIESFTECCQEVTEAIADGNTQRGMQRFFAEARNAYDPKHLLETTKKVDELVKGLEALGGRERTDLISVAFVGETYVRLRFVVRRKAGFMLFTYYGELSEARWHSVWFTVFGSSEWGEIVPYLDDADIRPKQKQRQPQPGATDNPDDAQRLREDH